ncbi:N-methyl-L-tryptophan oxidase [Rivibacter subsaxonicus]|uniref:N-methyl-L-tryptophan oxidase n=1 Tax=Rivibacter subsaxonicus TaxID=457575 RepID=UPI00102AFA4B|nr:N-methyl-L-tryptophan oxidase [Rivibacter subsaxonicus]
MTAATAPDVIVVGLGAVGSAVAHHLARRGARVLGLDRFHPPHDQGSSHGRTRITRLAVGEGVAYVPLVQRSHLLWRELEAETGEHLYQRTGGLVIASSAADAAAFHGQAGFFARTLALAQRFGIEHELLDAAALRERYPQFLLRDDESAYLEREAGMLFPERCVAAQLQAAQRHGATLVYGETVQRIECHPQGVSVHTDRATHHAARVVLSAGAWLPALAGPALAARLAVRRQVLQWFGTDTPALYAPQRCPVFIWLHGPEPADCLYGFPTGDGVDGVKVGTEQVATRTAPDAVDRQVRPEEVRAVYERHVRGRLHGLRPDCVASATCLYTSTENGDFIVDEHPDAPRVTLVSACSGHGFKHSAALGEAVAQRVLGEAPRVDLGPFALG